MDLLVDQTTEERTSELEDILTEIFKTEKKKKKSEAKNPRISKNCETTTNGVIYA